jgi:Papain family cysteine protease
MRTFGKGCNPSPPDERDWSVERLGVAIGEPIPDEIDNDHLIEEVYDQYGQSCVGWGSGRGWHLRARLQGDSTAKYPSALAIYAPARAAEQGLADAPLQDNGTYIRTGLLAMAKLGVVPLELWNDPARTNDRPPWDILQASADRRGVQYARVYGVTEMRRALANRMPLVFGIQVDTSFEDHKDGVWNGMKGASKGGHCMCAIGYSLGAFRIVNSWGRDHGEGGLCWIADHAMESSECWAIQLTT